MMRRKDDYVEPVSVGRVRRYVPVLEWHWRNQAAWRLCMRRYKAGRKFRRNHPWWHIAAHVEREAALQRLADLSQELDLGY